MLCLDSMKEFMCIIFAVFWDFLCGLSYGNLGIRKEMRINMVLSFSVNHHQPSVLPPTHSRLYAQFLMASVYNNTTLQTKNNIMEKKSHFRSTIAFAAKLLFNPSFKKKKAQQILTVQFFFFLYSR